MLLPIVIGWFFFVNCAERHPSGRDVQTMTLLIIQMCYGRTARSPHTINLWVVMPYMAGWSCLHIMKSSYLEGFEGLVISNGISIEM